MSQRFSKISSVAVMENHLFHQSQQNKTEIFHFSFNLQQQPYFHIHVKKIFWNCADAEGQKNGNVEWVSGFQHVCVCVCVCH